MKSEELRQLVEKSQQCDPQKLGRSNIVYIDISSIERESKRITNAQSIHVNDAPSRARKLIKTDDVLVSTVRPNLNSVAMVPAFYDNEIASTGFCVLRAKPDALDPMYLFYFTQTETFISKLTTLSTGAGYPAVSDEDILDLSVPLPSFQEQRLIAAILQKADRLRRLRRYALELSDSFLQSVFLDIFGDPASNPKGWPIHEIEELLVKHHTGIQTGPFGSSLKRHEYVNAGIPVWGINNLGNNEFIEDDPLYITAEKYKELTAYTVKDGDILVSRAGTVGTMCVIHPKQNVSIIGTNLVRVTVDRDKILPEYFASLFNYFGERVGRLRMGHSGDSLSFMNPTILRSIRIPCPSLEIQNDYVWTMTKHRRLLAQQRESYRQSEHLFKTLLYRVFSDELTS
jgi:type I restriction enzyme S subunit